MFPICHLGSSEAHVLDLGERCRDQSGPHQPSSVFACESATDSFVFTEKSERLPIADITNIAVTIVVTIEISYYILARAP